MRTLHNPTMSREFDRLAIVHLQDTSTLNYITHNTLVLSYLHEVLFHVVSHELHDLLLTAQLLREGAGLKGKVFVVGQAVVYRP